MTHPQQAPQFADPAEAAAYAQYRQAQADEYGQWVAASDIRVGGALAFATGHPVPASTVDAQGWVEAGLVVPTGTVVPEAGVNRAEQLAARADALMAELSTIAAELGAEATPASAAPTPEPEPVEEV